MTSIIRLTTMMMIVAITLVACQSSTDEKSVESPTTVEPTSTFSAQNAVGKPVKGSTATVYRLMENGELRHINDWITYLSLGYEPGDIVTISDEQLQSFSVGAPITRWVTGKTDTSLYMLYQGKRYEIVDEESFSETGGSVLEISVLDDEFLSSFPLADGELPPAFQSEQKLPIVTASTLQNDGIWWATSDGQLHHAPDHDSEINSMTLPDNSTITAMLNDDENFWVGTDQGGIWHVVIDSQPELIFEVENGWISGLTSDGEGGLWIADRGHYSFEESHYVKGKGLLRLNLEMHELTPISTDPALEHITAMKFDAAAKVLWIGTRYHGLYRYDVEMEQLENFTIFNSAIPDNHIHDLEIDADGTVWLTTHTTLARFRDEVFEVFPSYEAYSTDGSVLKLSVGDDSVWVASEHFIGHWTQSNGWQLFSAFDHPNFLDDFRGVILNDEGQPSAVGSRYLIHFDGDMWTANDLRTNETIAFMPNELPQAVIVNEPVFPSPTQDYEGWLQAFPRPENDNGRCMHYLQSPSGSELEIRQQIARLQRLNVRWVLINYLGPSQLLQMAPLFTEADIMVIWRPFVRAFETYPYWENDVRFLRSIGLPPYIQVYNEPSLEPEWNGEEIDQDVYLEHVAPAVQAVVDAGGYAGLQHIQPEWTRTTLRYFKDQGIDAVFERLFFVPHPYGANHPPDYDEDINSVLGFTHYATVFEEEIGFVPMMIAGEGGWRPGQQDDTRYPKVTEELHRDFHVAVFEWFQTGQLSNGKLLPDYLFGFCPWLLSDPHDPAGWFDSTSGDRALTIEAVEAIEDFERSFLWDED